MPFTAASESAGLKVIAAKMLHLMTSEQAAGFYAEHQGKPFYDGLVGFMTSGPVMVVLEGEDAIRRHREIMGATNRKRPWPAPCAPATPRHRSQRRPRLRCPGLCRP